MENYLECFEQKNHRECIPRVVKRYMVFYKHFKLVLLLKNIFMIH